MAKDKIKEAAYKLEGLKRIKYRKKKRLDNLIFKIESFLNGKCRYCGGQRSWCDGCEMWSATCCEEYASCMCS